MTANDLTTIAAIAAAADRRHLTAQYHKLLNRAERAMDAAELAGNDAAFERAEAQMHTLYAEMRERGIG